MRGRKPRRVSIANGDISTLQQVARSRMLPWFQVQRARVILAMADGERVQTVALQTQCAPSTIWRICRRYERGGIERLLSEEPREGHLLSPEENRGQNTVSANISKNCVLIPVFYRWCRQNATLTGSDR
jgi:hypothetical protein